MIESWLSILGSGHFSHVIGVGGIGTGIIIQLDDNSTLLRTESRMGRLLDARDYCKLHIVEHYLSKMLCSLDGCHVLAAGNVGDDEAGKSLLQQMHEVGIDTTYVRIEPGHKTLFSVSFLYPDKSGGNITISNSAASRFGRTQLEECREVLNSAGRRAVALCLPEIPLSTRSEFLQIATDCGSYRIASFPAGEMDAVLGLNLLEQVDMLALNEEEAATLGGTPNAIDKQVILDACLCASIVVNPKIRLIVSSGAEGISVFDQGEWSHHPAIPTSVVSSAGAGDALLAGVIAGIVAGLPFVSRDYQEPSVRKRRSAIDLGLLVAAFSLTSPHTIHPDFSQQTLWEFDKTAVSHG